MSPNPRRAAFTLIELLIVISLLALLAGLVVPAVQGAMTIAQISATQTRLQSIKLALDAYRSALTGYPASDPALLEHTTGSPDYASTGAEVLRFVLRSWYRAADGSIVQGQGYRKAQLGGFQPIKPLYTPSTTNEEFSARDPNFGFGGAAKGYFFAGTFSEHRPILYFKARPNAGGGNPLVEAHNAKISNKWLASPEQGRLSFDDWTRRNGVFIGGAGFLLIHPGPDGLYRNQDDFLVP